MRSLASKATRLTGGRGCLAACPPVEQEPLIQWMEERRRQKDREYLSQAMVVLYGWSHLMASIEASLLKHTVTALPRPPVSENQRGEGASFDHSNALFVLMFSCFLWQADMGCRFEVA